MIELGYHVYIILIVMRYHPGNSHCARSLGQDYLPPCYASQMQNILGRFMTTCEFQPQCTSHFLSTRIVRAGRRIDARRALPTESSSVSGQCVGAIG